MGTEGRHLQRLEAAGLVAGVLELSESGKAVKYFEVTPFVLHLPPPDPGRSGPDPDRSGRVQEHHRGSEVNGHETVTPAADPWSGDATGLIAAGGVFLLLIVIVWQIAATWWARMLAAREDKYRRLAAKYAQLLEENVDLHRHMAEELTQARHSIASMEKMMREIE